jgi:hypothetical protein
MGRDANDALPVLSHRCLHHQSVGICGVDKLLVDDGQPGISAREAITFLHLQEGFTFEACQPFTATAHVALSAMGVGTRLLAYFCLALLPRVQ